LLTLRPENGCSLGSDTVPAGRNLAPSVKPFLSPTRWIRTVDQWLHPPDSGAIDIVYFVGLLTQEAG
jgi:hypothetical protein